MRTRKAVVTAAVSAALLAAGLGAGSIASAAIGSSTGQDTKSDQGAQEAQSAPREATKFPENESGQTYGSAAEVTEEYLPDLVLVMTNEGGEGYVPRDEIFPPRRKVLGRGACDHAPHRHH